jgi:hypothetical protein
MSDLLPAWPLLSAFLLAGGAFIGLGVFTAFAGSRNGK